MHTFISCDWGTSNFRLRLVDAAHQRILGEVMAPRGIAEMNALYKQNGLDEKKRFSFYQSFITEHLIQLQEQLKITLVDLPLIISGMASSNIGMIELPYKKLPFATDGGDLELRKINATDEFRHDVVMISGARTDTDVMRGEETQLIGCDFPADDTHIYIFPGTHSKHITVEYQQATDFKTYMTGEFFHFLTSQSILSQSVQKSNPLLEGDNLKSFESGVTQSIQDNILHNAFLVRSNHLLNILSREENYYYLSGLLIGEELSKIAQSTFPITIVGSKLIQQHYVAALKKLKMNNVETYDSDMALVTGHCRVYHRLYQKENQSPG